MLKKAYLEITNVCNLACSFCHGTGRKSKFLSVEEFRALAGKLKGKVEFLFFHLMGEPLLHPELHTFLQIAGELGFRVILTTNGTLLGKRTEELLSAPALYKVSISLHSYEVNRGGVSLEEYLHHCFAFCKEASKQGILTVLRLWNQGGENQRNQEILSLMEESFPGPWKDTYSGSRVAERVFLEWGERFDWPDPSAPEQEGSYGCYGLRDQIGIHCDGTVVPCCLDADGGIPLGNLFTQELEEILTSDRAVSLKQALQNRKPCEELCRRCGYAAKKKY
ncbi:MAG: radical SAM protein [Oscillospiraceae bacterium]|nr:radical SAM protein [Oscillospiraceae bacterium]